MDGAINASVEMIGALAIVAMTLLIAWLMQAARAYLKTRSDLAQYNALIQRAYDYARAAQQLYESGQIAKDARFRYVADLLKEQFPNLTDARIQQLIETAVATLKIADDLTSE